MKFKIKESLGAKNLNGYYDSNIMSIGRDNQRYTVESIIVSTLLIYKDVKNLDQDKLKNGILEALKRGNTSNIDVILDSINIKQQESKWLNISLL